MAAELDHVQKLSPRKEALSENWLLSRHKNKIIIIVSDQRNPRTSSTWQPLSPTILVQVNIPFTIDAALAQASHTPSLTLLELLITSFLSSLLFLLDPLGTTLLFALKLALCHALLALHVQLFFVVLLLLLHTEHPCNITCSEKQPLQTISQAEEEKSMSMRKGKGEEFNRHVAGGGAPASP